MDRRRLAVLFLACAAAVAACVSPPRPDVPQAPSAADATDGAASDSTAAAMAALARRISAVGGIAFVGFKEVGQRRGVDGRGRVLVSPATVARMRAHVRGSRGVTITDTSGLPYVVVRFSPVDVGVLAGLLAHPNVDYVEADVIGRRPP